MSNQTDFDLDRAHHWFGVEFNNGIFPLLEKNDRTDDETEKMIQMAFASTLHWNSYSGGKIANNARGVNMIATTFTYAGMKEAALYYANRNHDIVFSNLNSVAVFDVSYSLMVMARANALNGNFREAKKYYDECIRSIEEIKDKEDKDIVVSDLYSGPWYGLK